VGKTTVACNLAVGLALDKPGLVALVDLDLQFGDVATTLDLDPVYSVTDAVARSAARDSLVLRSNLTRHSSSLLVLTAPESPALADRISATQVAHLLRQLADEFPYVVVDTSPGLGEHKLAVLEHSTDLVTITSMDVASVRGTRKELDVLRELELLPASHFTVVNLADRASGLSIPDIEYAIGMQVDVVLPRAEAVLRANNRGIPVIIDRPRDRVSRHLRLLVHRLESVQTRKSWHDASRKERVS
jgi:pilus assembly protein CpaE